MIEKINKWLENPKRKYAEGVEIFTEHATRQQNENFLNYLTEGLKEDEMNQFDSRFSILINQISFIRNRIKIDSATVRKDLAEKEIVVKPTQTIRTNPDPVTLETLPEELQPLRLRLKEIIPMMAKLHADMANENQTPEERLPFMLELLKLGEERSAIWKEIDDYASGKEIIIDQDEEEKSLNEKTLLLGVQLAKRVKQLRENIARNEISAAKYEEKGETAKLESSNERIAGYKSELAELEKHL